MNNKNSLLLVDPDFDPAYPADRTLLLKLGSESFSYAIVDSDTKQLRAVFDHQECQDTAAAFSSRLKTDGYLSIPFKEVKASIFTENTISIPDELYDRETINQYAKFFPLAQGNNLYTHSPEGFSFKSIFTLNEDIEEAINSSLANCKVFDHQAPLLVLARDSSQSALIFDFTSGSFNAAYLNEDKLIFQKYFEIENTEEFNYYLLYIINQLKISTENTDVLIMGIIHKYDSNYKCIEKYFQSINFFEAPAIENDNKILDDMPAHYYSSLLALNLCE